MKEMKNNNPIHSIYFLEHSLVEYSDNPSEEVIKKRNELKQQLKEAYKQLNI